MKKTLLQRCESERDKALGRIRKAIESGAHQNIPHIIDTLIANTLKQAAEALEDMKQIAHINQDHICRFNDGEQVCDCFNSALTDAQKIIRGELDI